jgi:hypothetical protein
MHLAYCRLTGSHVAGNVAERIAEIIVLAEDLNLGNFAVRYLLRTGQKLRKIRLHLPKPGRGSGEKFVRESYGTEVKYFRNRASSRSAALVVAIDADVRTVADREAELSAELVRTGQDGRRQMERIILLIPKRNIETWILCLSNEAVDETTDYKRRADVGDKIKPAAEAFFEWSRPHYAVPVHCVRSLSRALIEAQRLD